MSSYCGVSDLYAYGLPRGSLGLSSQLLDSALAATSTCTLNGHGFVAGDAIIFRATDGGTLATPLVYGTTYYALPLNDAQFQVSATPNGSPITLTADGVSMMVATALPYAQVIAFYSSWVEGFMPAHVVPFTSPYPVMVVALVAMLSAKRLMNLAGHESGTVDAAELAAKAQLERFAKGLPLRDAAATAHANLAVAATLVVGGTDPRGWGSGILPGVSNLTGTGSNWNGPGPGPQ